jgi:hypothetical protein
MQAGDGCSMAASAVWGRCTKVDPATNRTDDCNQFEPTPGNERKCECCEHHRSHHETPEQVASRIAAALVAASGKERCQPCEVASGLHSSGCKKQPSPHSQAIVVGRRLAGLEAE